MEESINDERGCSMCPAGEERYARYTQHIGRKKVPMVQYDYRHTDGELFACVGKSLEDCREKRDKWLSTHNKK